MAPLYLSCRLNSYRIHPRAARFDSSDLYFRRHILGGPNGTGGEYPDRICPDLAFYAGPNHEYFEWRVWPLSRLVVIVIVMPGLPVGKEGDDWQSCK
jgi:hypothetical protein